MTDVTGASISTPARASAWEPLRHPLYRALWTAQLVSNIGTWMQTVGAQWLIGSLGGDPLQVALVQAAITLPVFLIALPAGALGDIVDRRRLLLVSHAVMIVVAAALAFATFAGIVTPWSLLALTFALGLGQGLTLPPWQAIVPEVVERREIPLAAALAGVNNNLARAVGPAIGGALVAAAGPGWTFTLNAVSFVATAVVLARWRRTPHDSVLGPEHIAAAMRTGLAYVRHSPGLRAVLWRAAIFVVFAGALWAVLPVLVRDDLDLGSAGYGLLLGDVGVGAVLGAVVVARLRHVYTNDQIILGASVVFAVACAACALVASSWAVAAALIFAGGAWIAATSSLNGTAIEVLPGWVRSRGAAIYTLVFQGGMALSAVVFGLLMQWAGARVSLGAVAGGLVVGLAADGRWPLPQASQEDVELAPRPIDPTLALEPAPDDGPILVVVEYRVPPDDHDAFRERMFEVGRVRRRTGAEQWGLFRDGADPDSFVESFLVATWAEHLRQHGERSTAADRAALADAAALAEVVGPPITRHLFYAYED